MFKMRILTKTRLPSTYFNHNERKKNLYHNSRNISIYISHVHPSHTEAYTLLETEFNETKAANDVLKEGLHNKYKLLSFAGALKMPGNDVRITEIRQAVLEIRSSKVQTSKKKTIIWFPSNASVERENNIICDVRQ